MKKLSLLFYILIATVLSVWIHGEILMRFVLPMQSTQQFVQEQAQKALGRPVYIGEVGLGWRGLKLDDVRVESARPSEEKSLLSVRRVRVYWSWRGLLTGKIKFYALRFEKPTFHLVRYEDGTLNISDFSDGENPEPTEPETAAAEPFALNLHIRSFQLSDGEFLFTDQMGQQTIDVSNIFLGTKNLQPGREFPISFNARVHYGKADKPVQEIKAGLSALLNLNNYDWTGAYVHLKQLVLTHSGGKLVLRGQAENVSAPHAKLQLTVTNFSDELLQAFELQAPKFLVKRLKMELDGAADLDKKQVTVSSFTVQGLDSFISAGGRGNFAEKPVFNAQGNFDLNLETIGQALEMLADYRLTGKLQGRAQGTQENFSAEISAQELGAVVPGAGNLSDIAFNLTVADKDHAALQEVIGKINGGEFTGNLTAKRSGRGIELDLKARAPRIALPAASKKETPVEEAIPTLPEEKAKSSDLPPFYVKAAVDIDSLDAPFIYGEKLVFRADLGNLTSALDQAQGTLSLDIGNGEIKDLAQLTSANLVTGVLFGSLDVVGRVINSLNVLSVLNVFSGKEQREDRSDDMIVQTIVDENGQEQHILVPYEKSAYADIWKFKSFGTEMYFTGGVGDIKKGLFRSDRMSFNLTGDMNFNTRKLDMTVQAAPGLHEEDGVMPLTVRIGGTIENPQGSMSMMSSVTSMLTQSVTNNAASRAVKKGVGGFFGLFKKKEKQEEETAAQETPAEQSPAAE